MRGLGSSAALAALLAAGVAQGGTLSVALPAEAGPCDFGQLAVALQAQLPGAVVVQGPTPSPDNVAIVFSAGRQTWQLRVAAPGAQELRRELPAPGSECTALAETSALIIERYLESIAWTPEPAVVTPLPPPPPPLPWQLVLDLGVGGYLGRALVAPLGELAVGARHGRWQLTAGLASPLLGPVAGQVALSTMQALPDLPTTGTIQSWLFAVDAALAYRVPLPFGTAAFSLEPGVELVRAVPSPTSHPPLFSDATSLAASPDLGLSAAYEVPLSARISLGIRVRARAMAVQTVFAAPGENGRLVTSWVDGDATLGVTALLF